ncbi:DNA polymerase IV [Tannockella kyphosi]|uniref:DNA polymerase IV n=1 Tax=Tannockella kyphosi TaxID=2899121 RepID=UPI00201158BE|nr:DNA polymerase IV [Tannockella kyphosi]
MQIIFHIDINAFYASAEITRDPSLMGKPLVVSGKSKRSIITTASYEARALGIHSAMPLFQALKLCPDLIVKPADFTLYRHLSQSFFSIVSTFSDVLEVASIDECYVDMTEYIVSQNVDPEYVALQLQETIYNQLKINVSIGIAPNKFLAKMASDMKKPNGITVLTKSNYQEKLWPLSIQDMFGIGKKTYPKLEQLGFYTIKDIANKKNYDLLRSITGKNALILYRKANGIDQSKVNASRNQLKSVGNSTTLPKDTSDEEQLYDILSSLARQVSNRAIKRDLISNTLSITIKYTRFESLNRQVTLTGYTNEYEVIVATAKRLFDEHYNGRPVRLLGISLQQTIERKNHHEQLSLFTYQDKKDDKTKTDLLLESLNKKQNSTSFIKASDLIKSDIQKKYLEFDE